MLSGLDVIQGREVFRKGLDCKVEQLKGEGRSRAVGDKGSGKLSTRYIVLPVFF